jgi:hypothetical protein
MYVFVRCLTTLPMSQNIPRQTVGGERWTTNGTGRASGRGVQRNIRASAYKDWWKTVKNPRSWISLWRPTLEPRTSLIKRQKPYSVNELAGLPMCQQITLRNSQHNLPNCVELIRLCYGTCDNKPLNTPSNTSVFMQKSSYVFQQQVSIIGLTCWPVPVSWYLEGI